MQHNVVWICRLFWLHLWREPDLSSQDYCQNDHWWLLWQEGTSQRYWCCCKDCHNGEICRTQKQNDRQNSVQKKTVYYTHAQSVWNVQPRQAEPWQRYAGEARQTGLAGLQQKIQVVCGSGFSRMERQSTGVRALLERENTKFKGEPRQNTEDTWQSGVRVRNGAWNAILPAQSLWSVDTCKTPASSCQW